jgi:hypothetical protein
MQQRTKTEAVRVPRQASVDPDPEFFRCSDPEYRNLLYRKKYGTVPYLNKYELKMREQKLEHWL